MKWFKRSLWLAAWSAWLWLGVGLYRELPREIGPKVSVLPIRLGDSYEFLGDTHFVAVFPWVANPYKFRVFDADAGDFVREVSFAGYWPQLTLNTLRSHGVIVAEGDGAKEGGLWVVDLVTGKWKRLSRLKTVDMAVHLSKPWIAFRESAAPIDKPRSLVVVDWTTGAEVFVRPTDREDVQIGEPIFLSDTDRLLVSITRTTAASPSDSPPNLELWRVGPHSRLEKVVRSPTLYWNPGSASATRVAWRSPGPETMYIDVFDVDAERVVFSLPPSGERVTSGLVHSRTEGFLFSRSGRALLGGVPIGVWNVDIGTPIAWPLGMIPKIIDGDNAYALLESRDLPWAPEPLRRWLRSMTTYAVRDIETGALRLRCWNPDVNAFLHRSADGALGISNSGDVVRLPYRVNWPLLAFCQLILAMPLILLWATLRLRRRRAARLRTAEAAA